MRPQQNRGDHQLTSPSPPVERLTRSRWLDLRLALGVLLVLGSVVAGSRLVAEADDTVPRLAAATDLQPGMQLGADQVVDRQVRLDDPAGIYFTGPVPPGYVVTRAVSAGELIPRSAVAPAGDSDTRYLTLAISEAELPTGLAAADRVDVWTLRESPAGTATATLAATGVTVVDTGEATGPFGGGGGARAVTLALDQGELSDQAFQERLAALIGAGRGGLIYLTTLPDSAPEAR